MAQITVVLPVLAILLGVVNGQSNCSTYNPCGSYGYCRDNADGEWSCECKFWWNGTLCDEQTSSGKQVIALSSLLAFLMLLFYGLKIFHIIRLRKRNPKPIKKTEILQDTKLIDLALKNARRSTPVSSCIITILMIIIAVVALLVKWSIIQRIHNEIVIKYETNQSLYYTKNSYCEKFFYNGSDVLTFPVSCFLILLFIIRSKRVACLTDKCYGYGAPPMSVDFISHVDRKFAAVIFAICADELSTIMQEVLDGSTQKGEGVIVIYLLRLLEVFVMGIRYYPFLAAVYINSIFTLTCATLYAWLEYAITIITKSMCQADYYPTYDDFVHDSSSIIPMFKYYGTGSNLILIQLCAEIPRFLCHAYINVKIPMLLVKKIRNRFRKNVSPEDRMLMKLTREQRIFFRISRPQSLEMLYVRNLFRSADQRPLSQSLFGRLIPKKIYEWRDDFQFSTRMLCVYSSLFLLLYYVIIEACVQFLPLSQGFQDTLQAAMDAITDIFMTTTVIQGQHEINSRTSNFPVPRLDRSYLFAIFITVFIIILQLIVLLVNVRRNLFQAFRGDDSEIPRRQRSKYISYASGNIHFAGYFIGYLIWGFIIIGVFSAMVCISIEAFIIFGSVRLIEKILKVIIPSVLFILFKQYLNKLLAQYVFLQHRGEVLALNNRRILMIFIYFNFFLDAFLGFISSIMRLVKSVIGGIAYMCRLDYSPLGRKLETFDGGFSAYCGFIHTECTHRHPVMLVFVSHLYTEIKMKQFRRMERNFTDLADEEKYELKIKSSSRYIRKWKLAVFLTRNPTIVFFRKAFLNQLDIEEVRALNDIDNNDNKNMLRRLSIYTRRMSTTRGSIISDTVLSEIQRQKF